MILANNDQGQVYI